MPYLTMIHKLCFIGSCKIKKDFSKKIRGLSREEGFGQRSPTLHSFLQAAGLEGALKNRE